MRIMQVFLCKNTTADAFPKELPRFAGSPTHVQGHRSGLADVRLAPIARAHRLLPRRLADPFKSPRVVFSEEFPHGGLEFQSLETQEWQEAVCEEERASHLPWFEHTVEPKLFDRIVSVQHGPTTGLVDAPLYFRANPCSHLVPLRTTRGDPFHGLMRLFGVLEDTIWGGPIRSATELEGDETVRALEYFQATVLGDSAKCERRTRKRGWVFGPTSSHGFPEPAVDLTGEISEGCRRISHLTGAHCNRHKPLCR